MKGGIAAILVAAQYAVEHDLPMKIALGVDEENISLGSQTLVQTDFFRDVVFLVSAESGQIFDENQEFSVNYGRKGRFVLEVEISGQVAHAARSDQAVNAITQATKFLASLSQLQLPTHAHLGKTEIIPFFIHGETDSFSIPARATLRLNILSVPGVTSQSMIAKLDKIAAAEKIDAQVSLVARPTPYMEAYEVDLADPIITQFEATVLAGTKVKPGYAISVADENRFAHALNIPVISLGPIGGGDHTAQEWVSVDSLQQTVQAYQKILELFEQKQ
jgi:acetylornithine deacetylase/succinyl-diaminopimelate desuccinylase-like protein